MTSKEDVLPSNAYDDAKNPHRQRVEGRKSHIGSPHSPSSSPDQKDSQSNFRHQSTSQPTRQEKGVDPEQKRLYDEFAARDEQWRVKIEAKLLSKVDWHLLPLLVIMYLLNFLDRK